MRTYFLAVSHVIPWNGSISRGIPQSLPQLMV